VLERKDLFRKALQQRTTLVTRGYTALLGKADRRLPESFFLGLLEQHFSAAEAPAARHGDRLGTLRRALRLRGRHQRAVSRVDRMSRRRPTMRLESLPPMPAANRSHASPGVEIASTPCARSPGSAPERPRAAAA
jgi:hypothetical protein